MVWVNNKNEDIEKIEKKGKEVVNRKKYKQKRSIKEIVEPREE